MIWIFKHWEVLLWPDKQEIYLVRLMYWLKGLLMVLIMEKTFYKMMNWTRNEEI